MEKLVFRRQNTENRSQAFLIPTYTCPDLLT